MIDWPTQPDGKAWCFYDAYNWRWAVVEDAMADSQKWLGINPKHRCLDGRRYELERGETMELVWDDGFEGHFYKADDPYTGETQCHHLTVPLGWVVRFLHGVDENVRPEWKPREPPQVEIYPDGGVKAAGVHTSTARHHTVLYRQIPVEVGAKYQLRVPVLGDSHHDAGHAIAVGLDPYGGNDWGGPDPRWSWYATWDAHWENQKWIELITPIVQARSERITLYLRSWAKFAADAAAVFDRVELWADEGKPPDPDPPPTGEIDYDRIARETSALTVAKLLEMDRTRLAAELQVMGDR